jgi:hypothetical protein
MLGRADRMQLARGTGPGVVLRWQRIEYLPDASLFKRIYTPPKIIGTFTQLID